MSGTTRHGRVIGLSACVVLLLLGTALLLPFAGLCRMPIRILSLQICVPILVFCFWRYIWNFGLVDSTPKAARGRHFSSFKPETQRWLRIILKLSGTIVCAYFLVGILLPLEIKASKLLIFGGTPWATARVTAVDFSYHGAFFLEHLTITTPDGETMKLDFFLPGNSLKVGYTYSFLVLPGTSLIADAK